MACTFQATIGGKFAPLIGLSDEDMDMDSMITTYNTAVTDAASEILGKERRRKKPWVTKDVLDLCDERRDLKKKRYEAEGAKEYREANRRIQKAVKKAKEDWIGAQCEEIETCLNKKNTAREHFSWWNLTSEKQGRSSTIQDKSRKENPQKLTQLSSRSHPRHLVGKKTAQKDIIIDITSDSQVNSNFPNRWSPASLTFNNYFYQFLYLYIT